MRAGPNAMVQCAGEDAACPQFGDHAISADARCRRIEEDQVRLGLIDGDAGNLREAAGERAGIGMIVGEPVDMMIERVEAGSGANTALTHRASETLFPAPDFINERIRSGDHSPDRCAEALADVDPN